MVESPSTAVPKRMEVHTQAETRCHGKTQRGAQVPIVGKYGYSAGRRQGFLCGRENTGYGSETKGRYGPQEEKIRGKVSKGVE